MAAQREFPRNAGGSPPFVAETPNEGRTTPYLHVLIRKGQFIDATLRAKDPTHRAEASMVDPKSGDLPLFVALRTSKTPLYLVKQLFDACPYDHVMSLIRGESCSPNEARAAGNPLDRTGKNKETQRQRVKVEGSPLFVAVKYRLNTDIIFYIMSQATGDCFENVINQGKKFPLHVAPRAHVDVVKALAGHPNPPSDRCQPASSVDQSGLLPLHCFLEAQSSQASIEVLLYAYPEALSQRDCSGKLPLHYAMAHNGSCQLIQCFVAAYPKSVTIKDNRGNLPIHCAFANGSVTRNLAKKLDILLRMFPASAQELNHENMTPLCLAERCRKRGQLNSLDFNVEAPIREMLGRSPHKWNVCSMQKRKHTLPILDRKVKRHCSGDKGTSPELGSSPNDIDRKDQGEIRAQPPDGKLICIVCRSGTASHCFVPCGHVALCSKCAEMEQLIQLDGYCPVKNCRFFRTQKVLGNPVKDIHQINVEDRCVICLEGRRSHVLIPCGHVLLCGDCGNDGVLRQLEMLCPLARCRIRGLLKIEWCGNQSERRPKLG